MLGPLTVTAANGPVPLGGGRERTLLATLLLRANQVVPVAGLVDALWPDDAPPRAAKTVQTYILRLREALDPARHAAADTVIVTDGGGYRLVVDPADIDAGDFERLVADGRTALREGDGGTAAVVLGQALALWRGPAYADIADLDDAAAEAARLDEIRAAAHEDRIAAQLTAGHHADVIPALGDLVRRQPLRERCWALLMVALYRSDRQAEALKAFRRARTLLVDDLGIEPGATLRTLHDAMLAQDPELSLPELRPGRHLPAPLDPGRSELVGRADDLAWVSSAWERARRRSAERVFVAGPDGAGKTRLAAEFAVRAHREGAVVAYVRAGSLPVEGSPVGAALASIGLHTDPRQALPALAVDGGAALLVVDDVQEASPRQVAVLAETVAAARGRSLLVLGLVSAPTAAAVPAWAAPARWLAPLPDAAITAIAAQYPGTADDTERIVAASDGLPRRAHRLAAARARELAAARLGAAAGDAAGSRRQLLAAESHLVAGVSGVRELDRDIAEQHPATPAAPVRCPFKGLTHYDIEDAEFFRGRDELIARLVASLVGTAFLGVVGPSGSGKSSLVRAGLVPALRGGILPGSDRWHTVILRPGTAPLAALRSAVGGRRGTPPATLLADRADALESRLVVIVDQFEEVFAGSVDSGQRQAFLDALTAPTDNADRPVIVIAVLRADYYGHCARHRRLAALLARNQVLVGPMRPDELREAIELPARRAGLVLEQGLVDRIVTDVGREPGMLPLLSTTLLELWQHRSGRTLTVDAYRQTGGVGGSVARLADRVFDSMAAPQQAIARRVLLRLAGSGEGDAVVRRQVPLDEISDMGDDAAAVVDVLAAGRLVTIADGAVEVAHEALLREWPRLRGWLEEDVQGRRLHRHLADAARDWRERGRDPADLYRGARLAAALDWATGHALDLSRGEREFLERSRTVSDRIAEEDMARTQAVARTNRRLRTALAVAAGVLVVALAATAVAAVQRGRAEHEFLLATSRRLAAQALLEERLDRALLLAVTSQDLHDSAQTRGAVLATLARSPAAIGTAAVGRPVLDLAVRGDGRYLATVDTDGRVLLWDALTLEPAGDPLEMATAAVTASVAFSPDGRYVAAGAGDGHLQGALRIWRVSDREPVADETVVGSVRTLGFAPDGDLVAVGMGDSARVWDVERRSFTGPMMRAVGGGQISGVALAGDGTVVAASAERATTVVWDASTGAPRRTLAHGGPVALSPDGTLLATGAGTDVVLTDRDSGEPVASLKGHSAPVTRIAFNADGTALASTSNDERAIVWDVASGEIRQELAGHGLPPRGVGFSPDGATLYTAGNDGTAIAWDLTGDRWFGRRLDTPDDTLPWFAYSEDGTTVATPARDGTVQLWDVAERRRSGDPIAVLPPRRVTSSRLAPDQVQSVALTSTADLVAASTSGGNFVVYERRTGQPLSYPRDTGQSPNLGLDFGAGDGLLVTSSGRLFAVPGLDRSDVAPDVPRRPHGTDVRFSADGTRVAQARADGTAAVFDVESRTELFRVVADDRAPTWAVAFTPDGGTLVTGGGTGVIRFWSTGDGRQLGKDLEAHGGGIASVDVSPDGSMLLTAAEDGQVLLWDLASRVQLGGPLPGPGGDLAYARFGPEGAPLVALFGSSGRVFDVAPPSLLARACAVAGRDLTEEEWERHVPERPYRTPCADRG